MPYLNSKFGISEQHTFFKTDIFQVVLETFVILAVGIRKYKGISES